MNDSHYSLPGTSCNCLFCMNICRCCRLIQSVTSVCAGLYQFLPPDSREFEDLVKLASSFYLDSSSRGTFTYCKARLIHNELLEKEVGPRVPVSSSSVSEGRSGVVSFGLIFAVFVCQFIEKRREMKQEGRTEPELTESYCFLYPDKSKVGLPDIGLVHTSENTSVFSRTLCPV